MPPNEANHDENVLLKTHENIKKEINHEAEKSGVITSQPEKISVVTQPVPKQDETFDCHTGFVLCCNALQECWLGIFACACCCDSNCCAECINGTCEGFAECLEGCGDCCIHCCQ